MGILPDTKVVGTVKASNDHDMKASHGELEPAGEWRIIRARTLYWSGNLTVYVNEAMWYKRE